jgi:hypothetical protein
MYFRVKFFSWIFRSNRTSCFENTIVPLKLRNNHLCCMDVYLYNLFFDGQKRRWGRFSLRTSVSSANLHSICFFIIIFTITRVWHNRPGVAAVPIASQKPNNNNKKINLYNLYTAIMKQYVLPNPHKSIVCIFTFI